MQQQQQQQQEAVEDPPGSIQPQTARPPALGMPTQAGPVGTCPFLCLLLFWFFFLDHFYDLSFPPIFGKAYGAKGLRAQPSPSATPRPLNPKPWTLNLEILSPAAGAAAGAVGHHGGEGQHGQHA